MTLPTVLLTLGRLPKALDLARAFKTAGFRVLVAEPHRRHLVGSSRAVSGRFVVKAPSSDPDRYLDELASIIERERVDWVVPVSEEIIRVAALHERLPSGVRLYAMPQSRLLELHDKASFIRVAQGFGLSVPETARLGAAQAETLAGRGDYIVKPIYSCSGRGVSFHRAGEALPAASEPMIVQAFCPGRVRTSFSIAHAGQVQTTVVYQARVLSGTVAVCFERVDDPATEDWVRRFVEASGWSGCISFDFVVDAAGRPSAIECNPRATSGIHFIEEADLARAITAPEDTTPIRYRSSRLAQQFYPCLTETQASLFKDRGRFRANLRALASARDVSFSWRDPMPFLAMPYTAWPIIREATRRGVTFGEVAMLDIGWYG
jgi:ATP-grasp domain